MRDRPGTGVDLEGTRAVSFDAVGTLFRLRDPVGVVYGRLARDHGAELPSTAEAEIGDRFEAVFESMPEMAFPGVVERDRPLLERAWWQELVRRVMQPVLEEDGGGTGFDLDGFFDELYALYGTAEAWELYPETGEVLDSLRHRGRRLAVVTNLDSRVADLLEDLGLRGAFSVVVSPATAGAAKPNPVVFVEAARRLELAAGAILHVGDDPEEDVEAPRTAGLRALLLDRSDRHGDAGYPRIPDLDALRLP